MHDSDHDTASTTAARGPTFGPCPHIDDGDPRCDSRLSINHLDQAFGVCFGAYHTCPMYHRIEQEQITAGQRVAMQGRTRIVPITTITAHGRSLPLRKTGS